MMGGAGGELVQLHICFMRKSNYHDSVAIVMHACHHPQPGIEPNVALNLAKA